MCLTQQLRRRKRQNKTNSPPLSRTDFGALFQFEQHADGETTFLVPAATQVGNLPTYRRLRGRPGARGRSDPLSDHTRVEATNLLAHVGRIRPGIGMTNHMPPQTRPESLGGTEPFDTVNPLSSNGVASSSVTRGDVEMASRTEPEEEQAIERGPFFDSSETDKFSGSLQTQRFFVVRFLWQFSTHFFLPLSMLWYPAKYWQYGPRNQSLLHLPPPYIPMMYFTWIQNVFALILVVGYFQFSSDFHEAGVERFEVFEFPFALIIAHRMLISVKYGTMSRNEAKYFFTCPDPKQATKWLAEIQLLTGWGPGAPEAISREIRLSARKLDIDLKRVQFCYDLNAKPRSGTIQQLAKTWDRFLSIENDDAEDLFAEASTRDLFSETKRPTNDERDTSVHSMEDDVHHTGVISTITGKMFRLSGAKSRSRKTDLGVEMSPRMGSNVQDGHRTMMRIATSAQLYSGPFNTSIAVPPSLTLALLHVIFRACDDSDPIESPIVILVVSIAVFVKFMGMFAVCSFMLVGVSTYHRLHIVSKMLGSLIRPLFKEYPHAPMMPLTGSWRGNSVGVLNVKSWMHARAIFGIHFGTNPRFRSDFCLAVGTRYHRERPRCIHSLLTLLVLCHLPPHQLNGSISSALLMALIIRLGSSDAQGRIVLRNHATTWVIIGFFMVWLVAFITALLLASLANAERERHMLRLTQLRISLDHHTEPDADAATLEQNALVDTELEKAVARLEVRQKRGGGASANHESVFITYCLTGVQFCGAYFTARCERRMVELHFNYVWIWYAAAVYPGVARISRRFVYVIDQARPGRALRLTARPRASVSQVPTSSYSLRFCALVYLF